MIVGAEVFHDLYTDLNKMAAAQPKNGASTETRHFRTQRALQIWLCGQTYTVVFLIHCTQKGTTRPNGEKVGFFSFPKEASLKKRGKKQIAKSHLILDLPLTG